MLSGILKTQVCVECEAPSPENINQKLLQKAAPMEAWLDRIADGGVGWCALLSRR